MKKISILALVLGLSFGASAQSESYRSFKVHTMLGFASGSSSNAYGGGIALSIEPAYNINDNIAVGLRLESAAMAAGTATSGSIGAVGSYTLMGEYSLGEAKKSRPFVGVGVGLFSGANATVSNSTASSFSAGGNGVGFVPRIGYQLSHFRISGEYNIAPNNMGYLGVKIGATIGGGLKN